MKKVPKKKKIMNRKRTGERGKHGKGGGRGVGKEGWEKKKKLTIEGVCV
jgi:hypothetical protein